ncbi:probable RNA polymerase II nuclear localization protein SLC7A6OS [Orussus abietinus]|uniref:probable RNA polymerase II nuclear localization protein SLC7A6OS n=1 Tax=Orussus abietinus TaxID=222816 RepID=UPI0006251584|nr:probable RNA polymerase II nuclear localization protein SLC7A6OS [Orussus abietinus]
MAAILRVKRRNDDEPLDALIIACKRRKTEIVDEETLDSPLTAVVKFAGTVKHQEDNVIEHVAKTLSTNDRKANYKQHIVDITGKNRHRTKQDSLENRYRVINCFRSLEQSKIDQPDETVTTVIDVEDSRSCMAQNSNEKENDYVYDLYYTQTDDEMLLDHVLSIHPLDQELVFDTYRENGKNSENECESEDSNSESNWRNDYPDSDHSGDSVNDDDMRRAVENMKLEEESDLSSEEFVDAVDEADVETFGYKYAKYKARVKIEFGEDSDNESDHSDYSGVYISEEPDEIDE